MWLESGSGIIVILRGPHYTWVPLCLRWWILLDSSKYCTCSVFTQVLLVHKCSTQFAKSRVFIMFVIFICLIFIVWQWQVERTCARQMRSACDFACGLRSLLGKSDRTTHHALSDRGARQSARTHHILFRASKRPNHWLVNCRAASCWESTVSSRRQPALCRV